MWLPPEYRWKWNLPHTSKLLKWVAHDFRTRTTAYPFGLVSRSGWLIHFLLINWSPTLLRVCHLSHSSSWPQLWRFDPCVSLGRGVQGLPLHSPSPTYRSYPAAAWAPWWWITSAPCSPHQPIQSSFQWGVRGGGGCQVRQREVYAILACNYHIITSTPNFNECCWVVTDTLSS